MDAAPPRRSAGPALAVLLGSTGFSWGFVIVKSIGLSAAAVAFWRLLIGGVTLSLIALVLRAEWPRRRGLMIGAGVAFGAHQLIFIPAVQLTSIAIVTTAAATQPFWIMLVSRRTVGERVAPALFACAALALAGVAVVVTASLHDPSQSLAGDILSLINVAAFITYFLLAKRARQTGAPTLTFTAGAQVVAMLMVAPTLLWAAGSPAPGHRDLGLLLLLALGPGNGHLLLNWAHPRVSAALASLILATVPVLASVWAYLVLDEPFTWRHALGMALVATAIEIGRRYEGRTAAPAPV